MSIEQERFGTTIDGEEIFVYKMKNKNGVEAQVLNYGAVLLRLYTPDRDGNREDVVLGYKELAGYEQNLPGFGAFIGRNANRIKDAKFTLNGVTYELEQNDGGNNLHGGGKGYAREVYTVELKEQDGQDAITFKRVSPHMEQGFPGNLQVEMTYILNENNELILRYKALSDQDTVVNFTNHSYFNLAGHAAGTALNHEIKIRSHKFTKTDEDNIPIGGYVDVAGTPMDFTEFKTLGKDIDADYTPLKECTGYDHNYVLEINGKEVTKVVELVERTSGRKMDVYTNMPGMQLYTANYLTYDKDNEFKDDAVYQARDAVCLETQFYPNACNIKEFPSPILKAGDIYDYTTIYQFLVEE